jgi:hypothetical protein
MSEDVPQGSLLRPGEGFFLGEERDMRLQQRTVT